MSLKSRIQDASSSFTQSEQKLADFFLNHREDVINDSAKDLADKSGTSAATIVRFARTLGYSGLPALKMDLIVNEKREIPDLTAELKQDEPVDEIVRTTYRHRLNNLQNTKELMDDDSISKAASLIRNCRNVYLTGVGGSGNVCSDLGQKLNRIGISAIYMPDNHVQVFSLASLKKNDVLLAVSYTGETKPVLEAVRVAKEAGASVIAVTQLGKTSLSRLADLVLYVPVQENTIRAGAIASRDASLFVTDVVYLTIVSQSLEETKKVLAETHAWTERI